MRGRGRWGVEGTGVPAPLAHHSDGEGVWREPGDWAQDPAGNIGP